MKHTKSILAICLLFSITSYGQSSLSISVPTIWSSVKIKDNWTPPTAPHYKKYRSGSAFGYGVSVNYSFQPKFFLKNLNLFVNIGGGYFEQKFNIRRPFDYDSPLYMVYYTDHYSYHCWQGSFGLTYSYVLRNDYTIIGNVSYMSLRSFRQEYSPTAHNRGTQVNKHIIHFGQTVCLSLGVQRNLGKQIVVRLDLLLPYTCWRNDSIFRDDPATFSSPTFSIGTSISIAYHFNKNQQ